MPPARFAAAFFACSALFGCAHRDDGSALGSGEGARIEPSARALTAAPAVAQAVAREEHTCSESEHVGCGAAAGGGACSEGTAGQDPPAAAPAAGPRVFGAPITSEVVSLAEIAQHPDQYAGKELATTGQVTAVCKERGCWLELSDAAGRAHVRMHGHSFFVPRTAPGHVAKVEGTLVSSPPGATSPNGLARVEIDARGVEID